jgi:hypothetical protein
MNSNTHSPQSVGMFLLNFRLRRGMAFGVLIIAALILFEMFNYTTTEYALVDLLGDLTFLGISWATILALAFCGIDFAGIARLHTPEEGNGQPTETWYLFGAWLLAATMNAMLTWWGVSLALINHSSLGGIVIDQETLLRIVPIFVAVLVWLIRVLIIGTYSTAGLRLLSQRDVRPPQAQPGYARNPARPAGVPVTAGNLSTGLPGTARTLSKSPVAARSARPAVNPPELDEYAYGDDSGGYSLPLNSNQRVLAAKKSK